MHYNTFDAIAVDIEDFKRQIREKGKVPAVISIDGILPNIQNG
jgi:hypothetical protein